jgi:trimethylamine--corrinoid protein Co-methyltransferase
MINNLQLKLLTADEVGTIYDKCLDFLSTKGVQVEHPEGLNLLKRLGADVDFDHKMVLFPKDVIETALRSVPHSFTLAGRNERNDLIIPHPSGLFYARPNTGARSYLDPGSKTYRDVTLADVIKWAQLVDVLDEMDAIQFPTPRDVPAETADIHALKALFENTPKHVMVQPYSFDSLEYLFQLTEIVAGGTKALKKRPIISMLCCSVTPLAFKGMDMEAIIQSCRYGVPIHAFSLPSAGGTAPITMAGTILLSGIEILAMLVMSQLIQPGTQLFGSPLYFTLDMGNGRNLQANTESILGAAATVQFIKEAFHIPTHTYGFGTDTHTEDGQSAFESALRGVLVSQAGCDILGGAGQLDVATAIGPIQLIIDCILVNILKRMRAGVKVDNDTLAWEEILDTAPVGHFLDRPHTLKHCHEALRLELLVSQPMAIWSSEGGKELYTRALEKYEELRKKFQPQPLAQDMQEELNRIVKQADEHLVKK